MREEKVMLKKNWQDEGTKKEKVNSPLMQKKQRKPNKTKANQRKPKKTKAYQRKPLEFCKMDGEKFYFFR